ncbi:hypothetical protein VPH35_131556 [Triticum aestivum]
MVVKLINGGWEVIYFVGEHNHPLLDKPCLTKYLRSHQGIPAEERTFLTHLHNCNLTTAEELGDAAFRRGVTPRTHTLIWEHERYVQVGGGGDWHSLFFRVDWHFYGRDGIQLAPPPP